jgi:PmbA protein
MNEIIKVVKDFLRGRYEFEVFFQRVKKLKVESYEAHLESLQSSEETGVGIRLLRDGKVGFSYTSDVNRDSIVKVVESAIQMIDIQNPDEANGFMNELKFSKVETVFDEDGVNMTLEDRMEFVFEMERVAKGADRRIVGIRKSSMTESVSEVGLYNSYGVSYFLSATHYTATIAAVASDKGDSTIGYEFQTSRRFADLNSSEISKEAVFKAVSLLGPKEIQTTTMPVILYRDASASLLSGFVDMFLGDSLIKGKTMLRDRIGAEVSTDLFTLIDDGTMQEGFGTYTYDAEGHPSQREGKLMRRDTGSQA